MDTGYLALMTTLLSQLNLPLPYKNFLSAEKSAKFFWN